MIIIYHHPKCKATKKCIKVLETTFAEEHNVQHEGMDISEEKLKEIMKILNCTPVELIKTGEKIWKTLLKYLSFTDEELIKILLQYPILLKSPIIINGNKAVIGRPPELILDVL